MVPFVLRALGSYCVLPCLGEIGPSYGLGAPSSCSPYGTY